MYLERLKTYGPKLLCVITLTEDLALERAAEADRELRAGRYRGPLHGIPYGVKDLFDSKGILTTWGAEPFEKRVPDQDATVVERLNKAGAVCWPSSRWARWRRATCGSRAAPKTRGTSEQGSSGSSAGSASATSAGLVGFSLGTETLGSIVSPSTQCGTVGLRPTYGRVSRHGAMALSWTMDKIGPICRGVEDCALVLDAIYGPDGHDRTVAADPFHWEPQPPAVEHEDRRAAIGVRPLPGRQQEDLRPGAGGPQEGGRGDEARGVPGRHGGRSASCWRPKARRRSTTSRATARCAR